LQLKVYNIDVKIYKKRKNMAATGTYDIHSLFQGEITVNVYLRVAKAEK
jgi:hypothetical protein